jgi:hypothetical protein
MNRRFLLTGASMLALTACGGISITPTQIQADVQAIADAAAAMTTDIEAVVPATNAAVLAEVETAATTIGQDATALGSIVTTGSIQQLVQGIVTAIITYDNIVPQFFPASAPVIAILNAALTVAAALAAQLGITMPTPAAASFRARRAVAPMPLSLARATLGKVHKRGADFR